MVLFTHLKHFCRLMKMKKHFYFEKKDQGWVKTEISHDKTIQDRDKILKLKTRHLQDSHIAVKTIQDFQLIKNFGSRQVKNLNFSKFTRQDRSRQDSCQEKFKNS